MHLIKKVLLVLAGSFLLIPSVFSNVAQPGVWNAGGTGTLSLLFPGDSSSFRQIQMVDEQVCVLLFRGFAVVKGSYTMVNASPDDLNLRLGYPCDGYFSSGGHGSYETGILFDSLYGLKAFVDDIGVEMDYGGIADDYGTDFRWYSWETHFPAGDTINIGVYFLVNTNNAKITRGYSSDKSNAFIYLLESGASWKQPVLNGEVRLRLMDGLTISDIHGIAPDRIFSESREAVRTFIFRFDSLSPTPADNIILTYSKRIDDFNFPEVLDRMEMLYGLIDGFSTEKLSILEEANISPGDPFEVRSLSTFMLIFRVAKIIGIVLLLLLIAGLLWNFIRKRKKVSR